MKIPLKDEKIYKKDRAGKEEKEEFEGLSEECKECGSKEHKTREHKNKHEKTEHKKHEMAKKM